MPNVPSLVPRPVPVHHPHHLVNGCRPVRGILPMGSAICHPQGWQAMGLAIEPGVLVASCRWALPLTTPRPAVRGRPFEPRKAVLCVMLRMTGSHPCQPVLSSQSSALRRAAPDRFGPYNSLMELRGQNLSVYSVAEVNALARTLLERKFPDIWIEGEVSSFKSYRSGHWYFSLTDEEAEIRCVMFQRENLAVKFEPRDGARIRLRCRISLYERRGGFQAIGREMQAAGAGDLLAALAALREKTLERRTFQRIEEARPARIFLVISPSSPHPRGRHSGMSRVAYDFASLCLNARSCQCRYRARMRHRKLSEPFIV